MDYRKDHRTEEEFRAQILERTQTEQEIVRAYVGYVNETYGVTLSVEDNGVDNSGAYTDNPTTDADFRVGGKLLEVKFAYHMCDEFRLKKEQVLSCIRQEAPILFVLGWLTEEPIFTLIQPDQLRRIVETKRAKHFETWGKKSYFLKKYHFEWKKFTKKLDKHKK